VIEERFELALSTEAGRSVVHVHGELDVSTAPMLGAALLAMLDQPEALVVDVRSVTFMDSSGLKAITDAWQAAERRDEPRFSVGGPLRPPVRRVFDVTGLGNAIPYTELPGEAWRPEQRN